MKQIINGADLRRMIISAAAAIENNKQALNELNVFPVPDGDTGTNMSMNCNSPSEPYSLFIAMQNFQFHRRNRKETVV